MLELYKPKLEDLWFRENFMSDEETMSFNHSWGGTIPFPESEWEYWYGVWVLCEDGRRFYRYLKDAESGDFVGEIAYHFDEVRMLWLADIIIAAKYRGRGYGKEALKILCDLAAERGIEMLHDDLALDNPAISLFKDNGFHEEYRTEDYVLLKKDLRRNKMKVTEEYRNLIRYDHLPERFRAGDFVIHEDEERIFREFVDNFYETVKRNGYVDLEDFADFMEFLDLLRDADSEEAQLILTTVFMKSAKIQNDIREQELSGGKE